MRDDEYLSPADLAALLHVPVGTVYQWNTKNVGPRKLTVGRHVRSRRSDVEAWLDQQATPLASA